MKRRLVLATLALGLATVTMLHSATPALSRERAEVPAQVPLVQAAGPLGSSCDGGEGVYLYEHDDYKGRCSKFTGDSPNPRGWHIGNDAVSSIRIVGNWTATLYEHDDYKGAHSSFSHDDPDLDNDVIGNDQVSSVRVERRSGGGPAGYSFCSREDQRCSFSGTKDVAYGADGRFSYKYRVTGGIDCNNATFGDPYSGVVKACYVRDSSGGGCVPNADQIALFVDADYGGQCVVKGLGSYANPSAIGLPNDSISSIKVGSNVKAMLCHHDNYGGQCETFTGRDSNLSNNAVGNDQVSSVRVERRSGGGPAGYSFCSHENQRCHFSGTKDVAYGTDGRFSYKYGVTGGIDCNNATFGDPYSGVVKACYVKDSSGGGCVPNADQIALFVDSNYGGQCVAKGLGSYANPNAIGLPNDSISSIKVGSNVKATLCHHDNYGGQCETFTGNDSNLSNNAVGNDQVSSVRVERRGGGGPAECPVGRYRAQYYNSASLSGNPILTRCEGGINYDWGGGGPGNGVPSDNFSVRWVGRFDFSAGDYTFIARADDGVRLWVDGHRIINAWKDQAATEYRARRSLTAGQHEVKVEYYERGGAAVAQVRWEYGPVTCPKGQYCAQYYNNRSLSGNPALTRCERRINYDWGGAGPGNGVPSDNFSVRWVGRFDFSAGDYTFIARADDGIRLWVDGHRIINAWKDQAATEYRARRSLAAGQHEVKVEYYERGGAAVAQVRWEYGPATCPEGQYCAQYYSNRSLSGNPILTRCERRINYDWGGGGPGNGVPSDNFSVRWVGRFDFGAGDYTFIARADDGVRLWVDGHRIINAWKDQAATEYRARRSLTAGQHEVKLEYYEHGGAAVAQVRWERRNASCPPRNCTQGKYAGRDFFVQVVQSLSDVPMSNFAVDALLAWKPHENTNACWNPLATTWKMESVCNFNSVGVQHYQDQNMGVRATANTINQGYYDAIRRMLRLEAFDREAVRTALGTWGTCSGRRCDSLLNKWQDLWNAR